MKPRGRFVSLQAKFFAGTALVVTVVMGVVVIIVDSRQHDAIVEEVQERGAVLARSLAAVSTGPLLLYHFTALEQNVSRLAREVDVTYAIVLDREGRVAAHSQDAGRVGSLPADPASARAVASATALAQAVTSASGERLLDFAVPVHVGQDRWGTVRVGLSRRRLEAEVRETRRELAVLALVVLLGGGLASALVARRIARPVRDLARAAEDIARGELDRRIAPASSDEIGRLGEAFNRMATELGRQRAALEAAHEALRLRFAELSDLKSYTDSVVGSLTTGVITLDLDGRVVTLNPAAEELTGCLLARVHGRPWADAFAEAPQLAEFIGERRGGAADPVPMPLVLGRSPAAGLPVEATSTPLRGAGGSDLGLVVVLRDLRAVRLLEEQLRRSDRLAAIGTLAAGLAHEIKNPLTSILTFSRHLTRRFADERFRQRFQTVVPRELERINAIVEQLLRLAAPTRLAPRPVDVRELLEQVVELYGDRFEARQIQLIRDYAPEPSLTPADPTQLYQALVNLVANALEAMGESGVLTLRVGLADGPVPVGRVGVWRGARHLEIDIQDTGGGIAVTDRGQVFNPFFTTKPGGTGLGLAIAHKIVEDHGGVIGFRSAAGQGTTFTVSLPVTAGRRLDRSGLPPALGAAEGSV